MNIRRLGSLQILIVFVVFFAGSHPAAGWGADGHRVVGDIAMQHLTPVARAEVERLLALDEKYDSLADACNWADEIRSDQSYRWASRLHYVNIPKEESAYVEDRDCQPKRDCPADTKCPPRDCVVSAIGYYLDVLRNPEATDAEKLIALKFVGHFVGDIHQPLHAGYARDRGGNDVRVEFNHNVTNLHKVWDTMMIREMGRWTELAASLNDELKDSSAKERVQSWASELDAAHWAAESNAIVPQLYKSIPKSGQIGEAYQKEHTALVRSQLQKGGVRLAGALNKVLSP